MAVLSRPKISPQQRFDLEDFLALQSALRTDAKLWTKATQFSVNQIFNGFSITGLGLKSATVVMADAALVIPENTTDFSFFVSAPAEADIIVPDSDLTDNTRNFLEIELCTENNTPLTKAFWDPEANSGAGAEFNQIVNTVTDLKVNIVVSTSGFSGSPDRLPLAIIDTDGTGNIKFILDRRNMFGRLSLPTDLDNEYSWGTKSEPAYSLVMTGVSGTFTAGETITIGGETATVVTGGTTSITFNEPTGINFFNGDAVTGGSSGATGTIDTVFESFSGVDKSLNTQDEINKALMTEIKGIKNTRFWWQDASSTLNGLMQNFDSILVQDAVDASWSWSGTELSITDASGVPADADGLALLRRFGESTDLSLTRQDGQGGSTTIPISDGEVLFIKLPDLGTGRIYSGTGSGDTNFQTEAIGTYQSTDTNYWLAYRQGSMLYVRGYGEMETGESTPITDPDKETILALITANQQAANQDRQLKLIEGGTWSYSEDTVNSILAQFTTITGLGAIATDTSNWFSQTFLTTAAGNVTRATVRLTKTGSPTGSIVAKLYNVSSGEPSSLIATSTNSVDASTLGTNPAFTEFNFLFNSVVLANATNYAVVIDVSGVTFSGGSVGAQLNNTGSYASGTSHVSTGGGAGPWIDQGIDLYFVIESSAIQNNLALSQDAYIQIPGLTNTRNTISAQTIQLPNANSVVYVDIERTAGVPVIQTVTVADIDAVTDDPDRVIIARKVSDGVLVGSSSFLLKDGERLELDGALAEINRLLGQLRLQPHETDNDKARIDTSDVTLLDGNTLSQVIGDFLLDFDGAVIDFTTGEVFESDGTTALGNNFTPATIPVSEYQWYGISLLPGTITADNRQSVTVQVDVASGTNAVQADAPKPIISGDIKLGAIQVQNNGGNVERVDIVRLGVGSGSGGGGEGDANSFLDLLLDLMCASTFEAVTPYIAIQDQDDANLIDPSSTGSYSIADKRYSLPVIGNQLVSAQLLDDTFLNDNAILEKIKVVVKTNDTAPIVEASRNGGAEYQTLTMEQVDSSDVWEGILDFAQESTQNTLTGDGAITGANLEMNATTQRERSQPFTLGAKTLTRRLFGNIQDIVGSIEGTISARIVADDSGSPSTDVNDIILESAPLDLSQLVAGEIEFGITPTILAAGDYHIVYVTDDLYKSVYNNGVIEFSLGANDAGTGAQEFDGTTWTTTASDFALTHRLEGYELDLRVRIESSIVDVLLEGFGVFYSQQLSNSRAAYPTTSDGLTKESFNAVADNFNEFVLPFLPNQLLVVHLLGSGQSFRYGDFALSGSAVVFPENQFNNDGVEKVQTLIFDNVRGETFDNSDVNGALLSDNHLGSLDGAIDKSVPGRGIILQSPNGTKYEITIKDGGVGFDIFEVT